MKDTVNIDIKTSKKWAGTDNVILSKVNIYVSVCRCCIPEPESRRIFWLKPNTEKRGENTKIQRRKSKVIKLIVKGINV